MIELHNSAIVRSLKRMLMMHCAAEWDVQTRQQAVMLEAPVVID